MDGWMDDALILPLEYVMLNGHISKVKWIMREAIEGVFLPKVPKN
jgi:hypothetical protein